MMRLAAATLSVLVLCAAAAAAREPGRMAAPLPRLFPHWASYLAIEPEERSHFTLSYVLQSTRGVPPQEVRLWYSFDGEEIDLAADAQGRIVNPPSFAAMNAAPAVWTDQPEGSMSIAMLFEMNLPAAQRYAQSDMTTALAQANGAIRSAAGVASLFAPNYKTVVFLFDGPAPQAWAVDADGGRTALTVQEDRALFRPRDRANRSVSHIELGAPPIRVLMDS